VIKGFKDWLKLQEVGTSAGMVAPFAMPIGASPVARMYPEPVLSSPDPFFRKRKKKKKKSR